MKKILTTIIALGMISTAAIAQNRRDVDPKGRPASGKAQNNTVKEGDTTKPGATINSSRSNIKHSK